jgi:two-component system nitrogen regulation sensor histidine kinase NtrY
MRYTYLTAAIVILAIIAFFLSSDGDGDASRAAGQLSIGLQEELASLRSAVVEVQKGDAAKIWTAGRPLFLFSDGQLVAWSTNSFAPDVSWIGAAEESKFIKTVRGDFVAVTFPVRQGYVLVGVVPLMERFRITNGYLGPSWNKEVFGGSRPILSIDAIPGSTPVAIANERVLFHASFENSGGWHSQWMLWLVSSGLVLAFVLLLMEVRRLHRQGSVGLALLVLLFGGAALRVTMIVFAFPARWVATPLFDPTAFASSAFNPTIGDLFLNSAFILIVCLYLFYTFSQTALARAILRSTGVNAQIATVLCLLLSLFGFLYPYLFYETIFHNSSISLDWTHTLTVDAVRVLAFVSTLVGCISSFLFCHCWISLGVRHSKGPWRFLLFGLIPAAVLFFLYYKSQDHEYLITLITGSTYITLLYFTGWHRGLLRTGTLTYLYLLLAVTFLSIQGSFAVRRFTEERAAVLQQRFGQNFLVERDVLGEYLLQQASTAIARDPFIQSSLASPFLSRSSVRSKIKQVYLSSYFDRYDTEVHLFSATGEPLDDQSKTEVAAYALEYPAQSSQTGYRGIYFISQPGGTYAKQYIAIVPVLRLGRPIGFVALVLSLKKVVPQSVFPELLVDNRFAEAFGPEQYSYAIFQDREVVSTFGTFNYEVDFDPILFSAEERNEGVVAGDKRHVVVEGEGGRRAVVTTDIYGDFYLLSNFAFWTLLGIAIISTGFVLTGLVRIRSFRLTYATRIQLLVFMSFVIPLVLISATTLTWTSSTAEERLRQDFTDRARQLAEQVSPLMTSYVAGETDQRALEDYLIEGSRLSGIDASIYSRNGRLVVTNQVQIFDNQIVSTLVNPVAFLNMRANRTSFIEEERIGKLSYNNAYHMLRSPGSGEIHGILSIPFFESGRALERSRVIILSNVMIVFMIILILFTFLALAATRWLTFPLRMITRSLSRTTLKEENKLLEWNADDEIGLMVGEYNKMVVNLERSKVDLARSQKESAWREIAQQVAHEIKNPLTPMKLTLQQLEVLVRKGNLSPERAEQALKNLLTQVEILNEIASSFSTFARMPAPTLSRVNAITIVEKTVQLYAGHPMGKVDLVKPESPVWILGDDQLLSRIFSNLILNGLQSGAAGAVRVVVTARVIDANLVVSVADNGSGIDADLSDKVFLPHFTTKKSGSGLGLAISRQGIEQSGGSIWFESGSSGTTFYVSLPVHR